MLEQSIPFPELEELQGKLYAEVQLFVLNKWFLRKDNSYVLCVISFVVIFKHISHLTSVINPQEGR